MSRFVEDSESDSEATFVNANAVELCSIATPDPSFTYEATVARYSSATPVPFFNTFWPPVQQISSSPVQQIFEANSATLPSSGESTSPGVQQIPSSPVQQIFEANSATLPSSGESTSPGVQQISSGGCTEQTDDYTGLVIRNIPPWYNVYTLMCLLEYEGFVWKIVFLYLPLDFPESTCIHLVNQRYAVVHFVDVEARKACQKIFGDEERPRFPRDDSRKVEPLVGKAEGRYDPNKGYDHLWNSPIMHPSVPPSFQPLCLHAGEMIAWFPPRVRPPRIWKDKTDEFQRQHGWRALQKKLDEYKRQRGW